MSADIETALCLDQTQRRSPSYLFYLAEEELQSKNLSTRSGESICQSEATVQPGAKISL